MSNGIPHKKAAIGERMSFDVQSYPNPNDAECGAVNAPPSQPLCVAEHAADLNVPTELLSGVRSVLNEKLPNGMTHLVQSSPALEIPPYHGILMKNSSCVVH